MFNITKSKCIFIIPIIITAFGVLILYRFFDRNLADIYFAVKTAILTHRLIVPDGLNLKYLILFTGLILMSITDMLFEKIPEVIPIFLILSGFVFAYLSKTPLIMPLEALSIGAGLFILIDITKIGSYAFGDILTAGAIGTYAGIENIIIISVCAIILGKLITYFDARLDGLFDKSIVESFHMAFMPVLFLVVAVFMLFVD